jgi:hypothetical protein
MQGSDRRTCLRLLGAVASVPLASWSVFAHAASRTVPSGAFLLTRRVERELGDGKFLVVARVWQCRFSPAAPGMQVEGQQVDCRVDAPPRLAPLAQLERDRVDSGPFPALLDATGRIASQSFDPAETLPLVIDKAIALLMARGHEGEELAAGRRFLADLAGATGKAIGSVPPDLFYPAPAPVGFSRQLALPDDATGTVEVTVSASADSATGLLQQLERRVETRVGADTRHNAELWTLRRA